MTSEVGARRRIADTAAVIVTHRRAELARACAERILHEIDPLSLVVVVNDPKNAPKAELDWLAANVGLVVLNENRRGYGSNVNEGVRRLRGRFRYYLITNDDVVPQPGTIGALREALERDPEAALAGPRLVDSCGQPQQTVYRFPSIGSELASTLILPARIQSWLWRTFVLGGSQPFSAPSADVWLTGASLLVRASAFHDVEGFDEQFFLYSEETDLSFRMRERGWLVRSCDGAVAVHLGAGSTADRRYRRLMGISRWQYIRKHWSRRERVLLATLLTLALCWNSLYVFGRILLEPRSHRDKLSLWATHWDKRPHSARGFLRARWTGATDG